MIDKHYEEVKKAIPKTLEPDVWTCWFRKPNSEMSPRRREPTSQRSLKFVSHKDSKYQNTWMNKRNNLIWSTPFLVRRNNLKNGFTKALKINIPPIRCLTANFVSACSGRIWSNRRFWMSIVQKDRTSRHIVKGERRETKWISETAG
jgi:hypothetical protein